MDRIYLDNDVVVTLSGLQDQNGVVVTDAAVSLTVYESDKTTEVGGVSWPVTCTHQGSGEYTGMLSRDAEVSVGKVYWVRVQATQDGRQLDGWQQAYCEHRAL